VLAGLYVRAGRRAEALKLLDEGRAMARHTYVKPSSMAQLFIGLGDLDEAFRWLDRAREEHNPTLATLRLETCWDPIRGDARFQALLRQVKALGSDWPGDRRLLEKHPQPTQTPHYAGTPCKCGVSGVCFGWHRRAR